MDKTDFVSALRTALMQLDDLQSLRKNPLLSLYRRSGLAEDAIAFQQLILQKIEAIKDEASVGAERAYDILYYRYLEQLNQEDVAFQLGVSVRQLRREQNNAIELLADLLWNQLDPAVLNSNKSIPDHHTAPPAGQAHTDAAIDEEVAWLCQEARTQPSEFPAELHKALADADVLAKHHAVCITLSSLPKEPLRAAVPPMVLRQALLIVITSLIPRSQENRLHVSFAKTETHLDVQFCLSKSTVPQKPAPRLGEKPSGSAEFENALHTASRLLAPFHGHVYNQSGILTLSVPRLGSTPILVIDDNPDARRLFQRYTAQSRFRIIPVEVPEEALSFAQERQPAAVVMDIMMPTIDGWDLLARWRQHPATEHIPVAVCTILPQKELAHLLGARLFIQKPVDQETFLAALEALTA